MNPLAKIGMALFTSEVVGKPFQLGGFGNPGYDCLTLIQKFVSRINPALIDQFGGLDNWEYAGLSIHDYAWVFETDPDMAREILYCWVRDITEDVKRPNPGDLLFAVAKGQSFPNVMIHAGNDRLLAVFESRGVGFLGMRAFDIMKSLRLKKES